MSQQDRISLTREELGQLVKSTVRETLTSLGVEADDPVEMQRDFQALRDFRKATEEIKKKGLITLVGIIVTGMAAALWLGLRAMLSSH